MIKVIKVTKVIKIYNTNRKKPFIKVPKEPSYQRAIPREKFDDASTS